MIIEFRNNFGIWHGLVIPCSKAQTFTTVMGPYNKFQRLKRLYKQFTNFLMDTVGLRWQPLVETTRVTVGSVSPFVLPPPGVTRSFYCPSSTT